MTNSYKAHQPRKRFGQHFLIDRSVTTEIIEYIQPNPEDLILEIGPGRGALTQELMSYVPKLFLVELDRDLIPFLEELANEQCQFVIYNEDALQFNLEHISQQPKSIRLVGNLPYNVATQLIFHFLAQKELIRDMYFMVQKEVAERLVAQPGDEGYSRLSVMVQYHCIPESLFIVKPNAFVPPPKVESAVVSLVPHKKPLYFARDYSIFEKVVRQAFSHRRKTLRNSLKSLVQETQLSALNIDPNLRPEQIRIEEYIKIANAIRL